MVKVVPQSQNIDKLVVRLIKEKKKKKRNKWQVLGMKNENILHPKLLQLCLTLCDPMDCRPSDSSVFGILKAKILEWVSMPSYRASPWFGDPTYISCVSYIGKQGSLPLSSPGKPENILQTLKKEGILNTSVL